MRGEDGVPCRVRTCDLLIKSQLLYQLSYGHAEAAHLEKGLRRVNTRLHPILKSHSFYPLKAKS